MFSTLFKLSKPPKPSSPDNPASKWIPVLLAGCLLLLAPAAGAQTLSGIQDLMKEGKMSQALEEANRYAAAQPKDAQGPFVKGLILAELGRPQEAIAVFTRLTETFPGLPEPYNNLAVLYAAQKQYDKAQAALEMAIRTHPSYAVAHENLGGIYAKLASQAYDRALQLDSANREAQVKLAMIGELGPSGPLGTHPPAARPPAPPTQTAALAVPPAPPTRTESTAPRADTPPRAEAGGAESAETARIGDTVRDWAAAWSRKDVAAYLAFYASDFQTPNAMPFRKWEEERRLRIDKPGKLNVLVSDIKVSFAEAGGKSTATARFRQQYTSSTLKSQTGKTLVFVKSGTRWLIAQERVS